MYRVFNGFLNTLLCTFEVLLFSMFSRVNITEFELYYDYYTIKFYYNNLYCYYNIIITIVYSLNIIYSRHGTCCLVVTISPVNKTCKELVLYVYIAT